MIKIFSTIFFLFISMNCSASYKNIALVSVSTAFNEQAIPVITKIFEDKKYTITTKYLDQIVSDLGYTNIDEIRARNLINALTDDEIDILWFVRGGVGSLNILPILQENLQKILNAKPKIIVGFSDVTPIHIFINQVLGWESIHGVLAEFNKDMADVAEQNHIPLVEVNKYQEIPSVNRIITQGLTYNKLIPLNRSSDVSGQLIGGNLTNILNMIGTEFQPDFDNKILIIEDTASGHRRLDRDLNQLLLLKDIDRLSAVVFGQFYPMDPTDPERLIYKTVINNFAKKFKKPVFYFPFIGHGYVNEPLIFGRFTNVSCSQGEYFCSMSN